jgi:hypothetical protein
MTLRRLLVLPILAAIVTVAAPVADAAAAVAPFGVGDSAGNIRLNSSGQVAIRWVTRRSGTISRLWVKTKTVTHGGAADSSYFAGTTGLWQVNTYTTTTSGKPDTNHLLASERFVPSVRMQADSTPMGNPTGEAIGLKLNLAVTRGTEYITVFQNVDTNPSVNYASLNFLYSVSGLQGAQSRNERDPAAPDALYGLDPRELVGGTYNGTWYLPGNNYGAFAKFLPTYVQQYSDGVTTGQPYYTGASLAAGAFVQQRYVVSGGRSIVGVGAYLTAADGFTATISVNGTSRGSVPLSGKADQFVSAALAQPLEVAAGTVVDITATPRAAGSLKSLYADSVFAQLMGLGASYTWSFTATPVRTVPLYPVYGAGFGDESTAYTPPPTGGSGGAGANTGGVDGTMSISGGSLSLGSGLSTASVIATSDAAAVTLDCTGSSGKSCAGQVSLYVRERTRGGKVLAVLSLRRFGEMHTAKAIVGVANYTIAAGQIKTLTVALDRTGRRSLKRFHRLAVVVNVSVSTASGLSQAASKTVTIKAAATHKRHKK